MGILQFLGLAPTDRDKELNALVNRSYKSLRVVGRGTIVIDPIEVRSTPEFKEARKKAHIIVESCNKRRKS